MAMDTSTDYRINVVYRAPAAAVFDAAASPGGRNGWWSTRGGVAKASGDLVRLDWSPGDYVAFRVDEFDRHATMRWTCVDQHDRNLPAVDEWVGTTLSFRLVAEADTTRLEFVHHGLVPSLDCYDVCEGGWDFFLRRSLRQLVEIGRGMPYRFVGSPLSPDEVLVRQGSDDTLPRRNAQ